MLPKVNIAVSSIVIIFIIVGQISYSEEVNIKNDKIAQIKKIISIKCTNKYTSNCLLLDLNKIIDNLHSMSFQILPGVYLVSNRSEETPTDIFEIMISHNQTENVNVYIRKKVHAYLDSLSLMWKVMDRNTAFTVHKLSDDLITELLPTSNSARGKKKDKESAMWPVGALLTLGTSALFILTGKAAVASLAALLLSVICYFRGHGSSHYTAANGVAYVTPYNQQCTEAIIDINGRGDQTTALLGYKKRTTDDNWNYVRYAPSTTDST